MWNDYFTYFLKNIKNLKKVKKNFDFIKKQKLKLNKFVIRHKKTNTI